MKAAMFSFPIPPISPPLPRPEESGADPKSRPSASARGDRYEGVSSPAPTAPPKKPTTDILEIVSKNAPHLFTMMREVMKALASSGVAGLPEAYHAAEAGPEAATRVAELTRGLSATPEGTEADFLRAATGFLRGETEALRRLTTSPSDGPLPEAAQTVRKDPESGTYRASGGAVRVEVDFGLFFSISERVSARQESGPAGTYYEAAHEVATRFEAGASIKIAGDYLDLSDLAEKIGPDVFDAFQGAVAGLSEMDDEALDRFFGATEALFDKIGEAAFGDADALDSAADGLKETAAGFFRTVSANYEALASYDRAKDLSLV